MPRALVPCSGDRERKLVVGARFGPGANGMPLKFQWYMNDRLIGDEIRIDLNAGDMYVLSEKAVGFDFKGVSSYSILTLRHAAGHDSYFASLKSKGGAQSAPKRAQVRTLDSFFTAPKQARR